MVKRVTKPDGKLMKKQRGAGRPQDPHIKKLVKMSFESESEYREFLKLAKPRERVEIIQEVKAT